MAKDTMDLDTFVLALLTFLANRVSSTGTSAYARGLSIGVMDFRVLAMLAIEPNITAARIVEVIGLNKGAVSRTLKSLEGRGLVTSLAPFDPRRSYYHLSKTGARVQAAALRISRQRESLLLEGIPQDDVERLVGLLRVMIRNADKLKTHSASQTQSPMADEIAAKSRRKR